MVGIVRKIALGILVLSSVLSALNVTPVAGKPTFSCSVSITLGIGNFNVFTTIIATGGSLPSSEANGGSAYQNGVLYSTTFVQNKVPSKSTQFTFSASYATNGAGAYSFVSTVYQMKGSSGIQLAQCEGNYAL